MRTRIVAAAATALLMGNGLMAQVTPPPAQARTEVPVTKVVLFSSGVGYMEHSGTVRGNGSTELRFKTSQINDILKSLVLQDLDGGRVSTITYPSLDPLSKTLRSFQIDITQNPGMAELLNQLRGAKVTIQSQAERVAGTVLGVEYRARANDKGGESVQVPVLNVLTGPVIRSIELPSINSLSLDDPQLQDELTKALTALSQARDQDKKPVTINFTGSNERRVKIGYVVETPIWKTSYRLILDDAGSKLQGWAIVENQTEADWNNVSLSLVSGRPISFMMDLYQPMYLQRPTVVPELYSGLRPQMYDGGIASANERRDMVPANSPVGGGGRGGGGGGGAAGGGRGGAGTVTANRMADSVGTALRGTVGGVAVAKVSSENMPLIDAASSVQSMATAQQLGELFQYTVGNVTLPRQKSAMLPIVTDAIEMERVSIYNAGVLRSNPLIGVRIKNTTDKHLLQGPVTVLDKGTYAGDARIDNVGPGQERLLSYGIDLEMVVDNTKNSQVSSVVAGKIVKGTLFVDRKWVSTQEYQADNKTDKDKMLVIEHPIKQGWKLVDTQKPFETTQTLYRFKGPATAKKVTVLTVKEERINTEGVAILGYDIGQLLTYSRTSEIPKEVRDALVKAMQLKQAVADVEREVGSRTQQINDITEEQNRIRENMKTVGQTTQYYQRLLAKLNEQESSIEKLQRERDGLLTRRDVTRKELEDYLAGLTVG